MDIRFIEFFIGNDPEESVDTYPYVPRMIIPKNGQLIRIDSGKYDGLYQVEYSIYNNSQKILKICIRKYGN